MLISRPLLTRLLNTAQPSLDSQLMDHEPQWESLAAEEQQQLLNNDDQRKSSIDTNDADTDEEGDAELSQKPVRSLKDSAPLSSCSEVTLNKLQTVGLLQPYQHDDDIFV